MSDKKEEGKTTITSTTTASSTTRTILLQGNAYENFINAKVKGIREDIHFCIAHIYTISKSGVCK
jgi:hypothetical protein